MRLDGVGGSLKFGGRVPERELKLSMKPMRWSGLTGRITIGGNAIAHGQKLGQIPFVEGVRIQSPDGVMKERRRHYYCCHIQMLF